MGPDGPADGDDRVDRDEGDDRADEIVHRRIEPKAGDADYRLLRLIAEVEGIDVTELPPIYDRIDHLVTRMSENPPSPEAQAQLSFSYAGYPITIDQDGKVSLIRIADGLPPE
ncbi:HalOD1 output domain-containing protein [Halorientalis regularis]|uniref:Halobacterial output domain-containing protein n=1 Tax=Halorientalis regularis TaxID=660518 RepID=A0A1G7GZF5_9EURY|nr:HalOD1 output domain-containing protein [Halorientalis regularis]SDE93495.1 hypothetical protein SAMN05216218_102252 [Halorientalis regularis]